MDSKSLLLEILEKIKKLELLLPQELSISEISNLTGRSANTIRKYVIYNFEPEEEYKKKGGKIYLRQDTAIRVRNHYASRNIIIND